MASSWSVDFDKLPSREPQVNYKYYKPVPRKKRERKQLKARTCPDCEKYYAFNPNSKLQESSRHRDYKRPKTPPFFWELDFPEHLEPTDGGEYKFSKSNEYEETFKKYQK
ncbi:uncharacterized protein TNIN_19691 [Trichonephila inaurata madagascariensis]|uniref:DNA endonuclease activator Ctp1 C-terminal domain-containing protein n=1 Tax=Trichonephila inaurata madagascariensis TaxID=2747483 RepID=A0A8X7CER3_9ARAC|nr:uncharacterized protein TNIN_19691 [Trichonephila inaurata madagascariensis]